MRIETFNDLITVAEKVADIVGKGTTEINIIVSEEEYNSYIKNPKNSLESYMETQSTLPVLYSPINNTNKNLPMIAFVHRSGVKVTLNKVKTDIYR